MLAHTNTDTDISVPGIGIIGIGIVGIGMNTRYRSNPSMSGVRPDL